jgi:hypothetical protein
MIFFDPELNAYFEYLLNPKIFNQRLYTMEKFKYFIFFDHINSINKNGGYFYPRRIGFLPKRIAM